MENEELIRREMEATRESLNEKVETLERKVSASVEGAMDIAAGVETAVHKSVDTVSDILAGVGEHPWLMAGGAVLAGYAVGHFQPGRPNSQVKQLPAPSAPTNGHAAPSKAPSTGGYDWLEQFKPELMHLKSLAMGIVLSHMREAIVGKAPPPVADHLRAIMDGVTEKLGGVPIAGCAFAAKREPTAAESEKSSCSTH